MTTKTLTEIMASDSRAPKTYREFQFVALLESFAIGMLAMEANRTELEEGLRSRQARLAEPDILPPARASQLRELLFELIADETWGRIH